jgi:16S rRNA (cytosine1402-N4)-methyltransferase
MTNEPQGSGPSPAPATHKRRPRYSGRNPRKFHEKYKELNPERYGADVQKVLASGKTPAGMHRPIMVPEILDVLGPKAGELAVDCTLGYGGHARAILERIQPGGRLVGLDVDPLELPRTDERLRAAGFGPETFTVIRSNFAGLPQVLTNLNLDPVDLVVADLGVSSMQLDNPDRGFTYKDSGPLDMRMNPARGEPAARYLAHAREEELTSIFAEYSDEPFAREIAHAIKASPTAPSTTNELATLVGAAVTRHGAKTDGAEASVRRVFQALRIAVNDEFSALETFLRNLPFCLRAGGRAAVLTFHSGEDRRVKKAFQAGERDGSYSAVARDVTRASAEEIRANPRATSAKLRWAVRAAER